jgi:cell division protein FtsW
LIEKSKKHSPDFLIFFVVLLLLSIGIIMVFSASAYSSYLTYDDPYYYLKRQLINALIGIFAMIFAMNIHYKYLYKYATLMLASTIFLLILTLLIGKVSGGAGRWIGIGSIAFQPSEIVKIAMVIFMAKSLSLNQNKLKDFIKGLLPQLIILGFVCVLILAQPDLGTAVAVAGTIYLLLAVAGARPLHLGLLASCGVLAVIAAIIDEPYRMRRIIAFINPYADPIGAGFQTIQSLLALGSGGLFGKKN